MSFADFGTCWRLLLCLRKKCCVCGNLGLSLDTVKGNSYAFFYTNPTSRDNMFFYESNN